jgi:uncharacterized caspase-like protein
MGVLAVEPARTAPRVALVMGVSDYPGALKLPNPVNDANGISAALKELNFEVITVVNPGRAEFIDALQRFGRRIDGAEAALFYYSGHAIQIHGVNYLLPKDIRLDRDENTLALEAVTLQDVLGMMKEHAAIKLAFLDACRDNPYAAELQRSAGKLGRSASVQRGLAPERLSDGELDMTLVFAALPGRTAADGSGGNSPFTQAILHNIRSPGASLDDVLNDVTRDVSDATNGEQIPERVSRMKRKFVFSPVPIGSVPPQAKAEPLPVVQSERCWTSNPPLDCFLRERP